MTDKIVQVSKKKQDENGILSQLSRLSLVEPLQPLELSNSLSDPLAAICKEIQTEFGQISKTILNRQKRLDHEIVVIDGMVSRAVARLHRHHELLKSSQDRCKSIDDLNLQTEATCTKFKQAIGKIESLQEKLPPSLSLGSEKIRKKYPILSNFLRKQG